MQETMTPPPAIEERNILAEMESAAQQAIDRDTAAAGKLAELNAQLSLAQRGQAEGDIAELMRAQQEAQIEANAARAQRHALDSRLIKERTRLKTEAWRAELNVALTRLSELMPTLQLVFIHIAQLINERIDEASGINLEDAINLPAGFLGSMQTQLAQTVRETWLAQQAPNFDLLRWIDENCQPVTSAPKLPGALLVVPRPPRPNETMDEWLADYKVMLEQGREELRSQA